MAAKIARGGLNYNHLKSAYERNGYDGLSAILGEKVNRTVHVTKHSPVIQKIFINTSHRHKIHHIKECSHDI